MADKKPKLGDGKRPTKLCAIVGCPRLASVRNLASLRGTYSIKPEVEEALQTGKLPAAKVCSPCYNEDLRMNPREKPAPLPELSFSEPQEQQFSSSSSTLANRRYSMNQIDSSQLKPAPSSSLVENRRHSTGTSLTPLLSSPSDFYASGSISPLSRKLITSSKKEKDPNSMHDSSSSGSEGSDSSAPSSPSRSRSMSSSPTLAPAPPPLSSNDSSLPPAGRVAQLSAFWQQKTSSAAPPKPAAAKPKSFPAASVSASSSPLALSSSSSSPSSSSSSSSSQLYYFGSKHLGLSSPNLRINSSSLAGSLSDHSSPNQSFPPQSAFNDSSSSSFSSSASESIDAIKREIQSHIQQYSQSSFASYRSSASPLSSVSSVSSASYLSTPPSSRPDSGTFSAISLDSSSRPSSGSFSSVSSPTPSAHSRPSSGVFSDLVFPSSFSSSSSRPNSGDFASSLSSSLSSLSLIETETSLSGETDWFSYNQNTFQSLAAHRYIGPCCIDALREYVLYLETKTQRFELDMSQQSSNSSILRFSQVKNPQFLTEEVVRNHISVPLPSAYVTPQYFVSSHRDLTWTDQSLIVCGQSYEICRVKMLPKKLIC